MHANTRLLEQFYSSFSRRDHAGMIACYAADVAFSDPVFTLKGKGVYAMWHMFCESGRDLEISFTNVEADEHQGQADWQARYTLGGQRNVHNIITARFVFQNGAIVDHRDHFAFWRWSRMALGPTGWLLGWTPMVRQKVQQTAQKRLEQFIVSRPEYQG